MVGVGVGVSIIAVGFQSALVALDAETLDVRAVRVHHRQSSRTAKDDFRAARSIIGFGVRASAAAVGQIYHLIASVEQSGLQIVLIFENEPRAVGRNRRRNYVQKRVQISQLRRCAQTAAVAA